ncbi:MAG TPA: hypothetical protein VGN73_00465 [Gemmatimonadaceae bacterium]|nr:hypothetical protein [Gemmatimonadaceae bacterium]
MVRIPIRFRIWRRTIPIAWQQMRVVQPTNLALSVSFAAFNILWRGHGILRTYSSLARFALVFIACYFITTFAEFLWLVATGPKFTGFESPTAVEGANPAEYVDPLAAELSALAPADLRDETLEFAKEMKTFEAGTDREFVNTLAGVKPLVVVSESERDEVLDRQSAELFEHNLQTWRAYREKFYRPARAFRDELRKRLGIRNVNSEPRIPALDRALLTGAKPITQAADYLAGLARRLK